MGDPWYPKGLTTFIHGETYTIGGAGKSRLTDHAKARALGRLMNWVKLCETGIESEFPSFSVLASFSIFNLRLSKPDHDGESVACARLAQLLGLSAPEFGARLFGLFECT